MHLFRQSYKNSKRLQSWRTGGKRTNSTGQSSKGRLMKRFILARDAHVGDLGEFQTRVVKCFVKMLNHQHTAGCTTKDRDRNALVLLNWIYTNGHELRVQFVDRRIRARKNNIIGSRTTYGHTRLKLTHVTDLESLPEVISFTCSHSPSLFDNVKNNRHWKAPRLSVLI